MTRKFQNIHHDNRCRCRDTTREEKDDETAKMTNIRSIAVPWVAMVIASVFAAAYVSYTIRTDEEIYPYDYFDESEKERFLANESSTEHHHVHKPVYEENHASLFPLSTSDRVGFSLAICGLMLAAGGGIGGGGILVPIYILVMGFSPKHGAYH